MRGILRKRLVFCPGTVFLAASVFTFPSDAFAGVPPPFVGYQNRDTASSRTSSPSKHPSATPVPTDSSILRMPQGIRIPLRLLDYIDSDRAQVGQIYRAVADKALTWEGGPSIPKGAPAIVQLVQSGEPGKRDLLTLDGAVRLLFP